MTHQIGFAVYGQVDDFVSFLEDALTSDIINNRVMSRSSFSEKDHKIAVYTNDVLLFITNPKTSIPAVLEVIKSFCKFSGYKIIF